MALRISMTGRFGPRSFGVWTGIGYGRSWFDHDWTEEK